MTELKKKKYQNDSSHRFNNLRAAHQSELAEDYVEMIYELIQEKGEARSVDLADRFGVSNPTVNASIQRLQKDGFVESKPYRSIFLTKKGEELAKFCKNRHEIVYNFLLSIGVNPETALTDAGGLENHVRIVILKDLKKNIKNNI